MMAAVLKSSKDRMLRSSQVCIKQALERLEMWLVRQASRRSNVTSRLRTGTSEVKAEEEDVVDRHTYRSGIILIWSGRAAYYDEFYFGDG